MAPEDLMRRGFGPGDDENILPREPREQAIALDPFQKQELLASLELPIAREFLRDPVDGGMPACPRCGCTRVVRKGKNGDGSQRWLCKLSEVSGATSKSPGVVLRNARGGGR